MKKYVIMGISLFLATLFLATIGNLYTGYSAYKVDGTYTLEDYPTPFIKNNIYNGLKIVLPIRFSTDELNAANKLAYSLQKGRPLPPDVVLPVKYGQFKYLSKWDEENGNLILIGDACTNDVIRKYLNGLKGCTFGLHNNQGYINLIREKTRYGTTRQLLILSGYTLKDLNNAVEVMANYEAYPLKGNTVIVSGNPITGAKYARLSFINDGA